MQKGALGCQALWSFRSASGTQLLAGPTSCPRLQEAHQQGSSRFPASSLSSRGAQRSSGTTPPVGQSPLHLHPHRSLLGLSRPLLWKSYQEKVTSVWGQLSDPTGSLIMAELGNRLGLKDLLPCSPPTLPSTAFRRGLRAAWGLGSP